jgi:CheY-like chemotaxis protein
MFPEAKPGFYVLFKVTDTGTGMPPEVTKKIFDPFFTTKEIGKGTGLGLSTVSSIVKSHGGVLDVQSEVGKGTEFRVYLTAVESKEAKQAQQDILEAVQGNGELILVVDDDAIVREIATLTLETGGYKVITAADGTEALGLYAKHQPDIRLVVTDMDMPIMDGPSLVRILRKMSPHVAIIGSSGSSDNPGPKEFRPTGLNVFLPKPYTSEMLLRLVYETLHQK